MPQQNQQEIQQIHHSLSRLALAKAIKTPDDSDSEPWQKSVIFSQPFIKELHSRKQQLYTNPPPRQERVPHEKNPSAKHPRKDRSSNSSIEKRLSELSIKKSVDVKSTKKPRSFLPSDSEEDENEDTVDEDDDEEEEDDIDSSVILKELQKPESSSRGKLRPTSLNSSVDDISTPSRGSMSSNTLPLTDEDEVVDSTPTAPLHHIHNNNYTPIHTATDSGQYNGPQPKPPYVQNTNMIDPMYYQRYQQYQQQLQYQIQYQQALALQQQQQQQQLYMLSQSPNGFYSPGMMEDPAAMAHFNKRHSGGYASPHGKSSGSHKMSKTDMRRREEMLRSSNEAMHRLPPPSQQQAMYYQQPLPFTPPIMKSNSRRPSYNL